MDSCCSGEIVEIKDEYLSEIIKDLKRHLPFTSLVLGLSISKSLGVVDHLGWVIRGNDGEVVGVMWQSNGGAGFERSSVWGVNLQVVQKLMRILDYDKQQGFRALPNIYRPTLEEITRNEIYGEDPHYAYCLSYENFCELNKTWKTLPNPIEEDLKQGNVVIRPIQKYYIPVVENRWKYFTPGSPYIKQQIANYPSAGIEYKDSTTGQYTPAAWVIRHNDLSIGSLHTEEAFRRKGLAKVLIIHYFNQLFQLEEPKETGILFHISITNQASLGLFKSLGLEHYQEVTWLNIKNK